MIQDDLIISATREWLERVVIGLDLCPFAKPVYLARRIEFRVSTARASHVLLDDLTRALSDLTSADPDVIETMLLIHPSALTDFLAYNDFLDEADQVLQDAELDGVIQIASFHPHYQFAGTAPDAIENHTNRSPYPMLHLLREASVERAIDAYGDTDDIPARNIETMRRIGTDGLERLLRTPANGRDK